MAAVPFGNQPGFLSGHAAMKLLFKSLCVTPLATSQQRENCRENKQRPGGALHRPPHNSLYGGGASAHPGACNKSSNGGNGVEHLPWIVPTNVLLLCPSNLYRETIGQR